MKAAKRKNEEARPAERNRVPRALDSGETRAIMLAAAFLFVFLYFIRLILLPFVLAAIVAYICTPLLDWAARRTRWPRLLFAIALFVLLLGVAGLVVTFAARTRCRRGAGDRDGPAGDAGALHQRGDRRSPNPPARAADRRS